MCARLLLVLSVLSWPANSASSNAEIPIRKIKKHLDHRSIQEIDSEFLAHAIWKNCVLHQISPELVLAIIDVESSFRPSAKSNKGALGLMQVRPIAAKQVASIIRLPKRHRLEDPYWNVTVGIAYLSYLKKRFHQTDHILAAYNMGPAAFRSRLLRGQKKPTEYALKVRGKVRNFTL